MPFYTQFTNWEDVRRNQLLAERMRSEQARAGRLDVAGERQRQTQNQLARQRLGLEAERGGMEQQRIGLAEQTGDRVQGIAATKYIQDRLFGVKDDQTWGMFIRGLEPIAPTIAKQMREDMPQYNEQEIKGFKSIVYSKPEEPATKPKPGWVEMTHPEKGRKTKVRENRVKEFKKRGWVRGVPLEGKAGPGTTKKLTDYKSAINQTLKKYGIESGLIIKPDGTIDIEAYLSGKDSVYQALQKKAAKGDIRAAGDLEKINYWYSKIDELTGVPGEILGRPEEERQLDASDPFRIR